MTLDDVTVWSIKRGIGHVVTRVDGGWISTACHSWGTGDTTPDRPKRICRICRIRVAQLRPAVSHKEIP